MSKSVLTTVSEYAKDPEAAKELAAADLEIELSDRLHAKEQSEKVAPKRKSRFPLWILAILLGFISAAIAAVILMQ